MVRLRHILFFAFAAAYVIVCPLMLFSAFGLVWAPGAEGGLERTGLLSISTIPSEASVYVGNRRYKDRTPMLLRGLQPGTYPVQVALKGYRPWHQVLEIASGRATVLDRLLLLPQRGAFQARARGRYERLLAATGSGVLVLAPEGARLGDLMVYQARRDALRPLLAPDSPWAVGVLRASLIMPESRALLWRAALPQGERYLWVSPERAEAPLEDLTRLILSPPQAVHWEARRDQTLWVLRDGLLDRVDRGRETLAPALAEQVRGLALRHGVVYFVDAGSRLERLSDNGERLGPLPSAHQPEAAWVARARRLELWPLQDEALWLLRDDQGGLAVNRPGHPLLAEGVHGVAVHPSEPVAVVWNERQIGLVDGTPLLLHPEPGARARVRWLATGRRDVRRVFWIAEGDYLVVQEGVTLSLLQLWRTPYASIEPLLNLKAGTAPAWPEGSGSLHYLDPSTGQLMTLELVPERYFSLLRWQRQRAEPPLPAP